MTYQGMTKDTSSRLISLRLAQTISFTACNTAS